MVARTDLTLLVTALASVARRARNRQEFMTEQICKARDALAAAQRKRVKFRRYLSGGTIQPLYALPPGLGHSVEKLKTEPVHARSEMSAVRRELSYLIK